MKKILVLLITVAAMTATAQIQRQTVHDTTRTDGQRFIVSYPYEQVIIRLVDSMQYVDSTWSVVDGYKSMASSTATFRVMRVRIIGEDTISRGEDEEAN